MLEAIKERGSLLAASKALGIPHPRAWEEISRIESIVRRRIIMRSLCRSSRGVVNSA